MSIPLLNALTKYYKYVDKAAKKPGIVVPSELDFIPQDDLESTIWVLTYAILLHPQEGVCASDKAEYKLDVVDRVYRGLSYTGLRSAPSWCTLALPLSLINLKNEFPTPPNANGLNARTLVDVILGYLPTVAPRLSRLTLLMRSATSLS